MDRPVAKQLIDLLLSLDGPLNDATELSAKIANADERKAVRRAIGEITARAYTDLIRPIVRQYPDLDPEKVKSPNGD